LFLHGWGVDSRIWRQQSKYFSLKYQVITLDLPGHGQSSWQECSLLDIAKGGWEVLEQLGLESVRIAGSSLGGLVGLKMFEVNPSRVNTLSFIGSQPKFVQSEQHPYGLPLKQIQRLGQQLETDYPSIIHIFFRSLFTIDERKTRRFKWIQKFRNIEEIPTREALSGLLAILGEADLREVLRGVDIPVQFINGTEDMICPPALFDSFKESLPQARFDWFEKCGHFPFLTKPHEVNHVLEKFLVSTEAEKEKC
ncbi:MAG: alpha/beta hydrolase, partial [Candidatus Omnitrophica bacterium]|nr:alpha/beta hydrolase [Candidatus Omnitrophota bacterium]